MQPSTNTLYSVSSSSSTSPIASRNLYNKLKKDKHSDAENKDEYLAENVFYVPPSARWQYLQHQRAKLPTIGKDLDDAWMPSRRTTLPLKEYCQKTTPSLLRLAGLKGEPPRSSYKQLYHTTKFPALAGGPFRVKGCGGSA